MSNAMGSPPTLDSGTVNIRWKELGRLRSPALLTYETSRKNLRHHLNFKIAKYTEDAVAVIIYRIRFIGALASSC
uniref:Uncharacterized protein n=1 Tax=Babesia bovis TaxID=5865 RepID=S6CAM1_BABBO|nr:hypothetical protein [Babesia bovis]